MRIHGKWLGFYELGLGYPLPFFGERVEFEAIIEGDFEKFKGEIKEVASPYSIDETSTLSGFYENGLISFVKTYQNCPSLIEVNGELLSEIKSGKPLEITYNGEYDENYNSFYGIWEILIQEEIHGEWVENAGEGIWVMKKK